MTLRSCCPFRSNCQLPKLRIGCNNALVRNRAIGAAVLESPAYKWEQLDTPQVLEGGRVLREQLRIRSHEVGPNQESSIVAISNALQVCLLGRMTMSTLIDRHPSRLKFVEIR
jgi:hypothetical protein